MKIREMNLEDAQRVSDLATQLGHPASVEEICKRYLEIRESSSAALFVASVENCPVAGWVQVNREAPTLVADARAEISALIVDENSRGLGIGTALVKTAENWAKEKNLTLVRIRSNIIRERAHRFYLREGYFIMKSWHLFTKALNGQ